MQTASVKTVFIPGLNPGDAGPDNLTNLQPPVRTS
jgi:hypothetical protein